MAGRAQHGRARRRGHAGRWLRLPRRRLPAPGPAPRRHRAAARRPSAERRSASTSSRPRPTSRAARPGSLEYAARLQPLADKAGVALGERDPRRRLLRRQDRGAPRRAAGRGVVRLRLAARRRRRPARARPASRCGSPSTTRARPRGPTSSASTPSWPRAGRPAGTAAARSTPATTRRRPALLLQSIRPLTSAAGHRGRWCRRPGPPRGPARGRAPTPSRAGRRSCAPTRRAPPRCTATS